MAQKLARDIAIKFNNDFGVELFPVVEPLIFGAATRVMSLKDGSKKMSKSDPSELSRITMTDDADAIAKKIRKARTDPDPLPGIPDGLDGRPEAANLAGIFAALSDRTVADVLGEYDGAPFSRFKTDLSDLAVAKLAPIGDEMRRLMADTAYVDGLLTAGAAKARDIAAPILAEVKKVVGFLGA